MKKIFITGFIIISSICTSSLLSNAQCTAAITGDTCLGAVFTAAYTGGVPDTVKWYKDGVLLQVRGKRNPYFTTVAGGNTSGVTLYEPRDMYVDAAGNMYIVDGVLYGVVKWAPGATQGVIVAGGNGKGTGLNQFFTPQSVAVDNAGNIYVSDDLMARVTKWIPGATSGVVVAGGNGEGIAANQLFGPQNICIDAVGNIYIADRWNHRIQKWAPGATTGLTVAGGNGNGTAANQFSEPLDVAVDANSNIFVVDYYNNRVQKWVPGATTGITVAGGNGAGAAANQFNFTTALSITADGSLYIRDQANYRIQKWVSGATNGFTAAGGNGSGAGPGKMSWGFGLFVDDAENIYAPELFEDRVDKFVSSTTADMNFIPNAAGKYSASITGENGCSALSATKNLNTIPATPGNISGPKYITGGQQGIIYRTQKIAGLTYNWTVPPDATIVAGQGNWAIKVNWGFTNGNVTVSAINGCGASPAKLKKVFLSGQPSSKAESTAETLSAINLYPNPANSFINIKTTERVNTNQSYITDISGKIIICKWIGTSSLDIAALYNGIYFLHVFTNKKSSIIKFIKQ